MGEPAGNRNADSPDCGLVAVSVKIPRWLKDEIDQAAARRLSTASDMFREALLEWLLSQPKRGAA